MPRELMMTDITRKDRLAPRNTVMPTSNKPKAVAYTPLERKTMVSED
ncbi:hypothetical protein VCR3J2_320397 [Vibrio coralliirubri]|nr:hypothetical protein VCR3J2_320397 [Vibrio coralliirubri]